MKRVLACLILAVVVAGLFAGLLGSPGVRAATGTVTWTSTADFDNGIKNGTADALSGKWTMSGFLPTAVSDAPMVAVGTKLYLIGGYSASGPASPINNVQVFDTVAGTWSAGATMPTAVWGHPAAYCSCTGKVYAFAGFTGSAYSAFRTTQVFDPSANSWTTTATPVPLAVAYEGTTAITVGSLIYVFNATGAQKYDPSLDSWTARTAPPHLGLWKEAVNVGDFIYLLGGDPGSTVVDRYSISGDSWTSSYDVLPYGHYGGLREGPATGDGSTFYVGFGNNNAAFFLFLFKYDPAAKVFTRLHDAAVARDGVGSAVVGTTLYVAGGRNGGNPAGSLQGTDYFEVFTPSGTTYTGYNVQTATDNPTVASNALVLGNDFGDTFSFVRSDGLTYPWVQKLARANAATSGNGVARNMTRGLLEMKAEYLNGGDYFSQDSAVAFSTASDMDVRVQLSSGGMIMSSSLAEFQLFDQQVASWNAAAAGTGNGILIQAVAPSGTSTTLSAFKIAAHAATAIGVSTVTGITSPYIRVALTASTNTWTVYWSADGATWSTIGSVVFAVTGPVYSILDAFDSANLPWWRWDNYQVAAGSPTTSAYQIAGSWSSPVQSTVGQVPTGVTLTFSGQTASRYISQVAFLDSTGATLWTQPGPIASASTQPVSGVFVQAWQVRVSLTGDGSGSISLTSISVTTASLGGSGGAPSWSIACSFNPFFLSWTCTDSTDYTNFAVVSLTWKYDNVTVATTDPDATVSFRAPGQSWASPPGDHRLTVQAYGGTQAYTTLQLHAEETFVWAFLLVVFALVAAVGARRVLQIGDRDTYYMPLRNPSYRQTAVSVEEYPKGWRSYRQRDPDQYVRLRSRRRGNLWVVYGIRPATAAEQERTGRKYIAEVQTVREKL